MVRMRGIRMKSVEGEGEGRRWEGNRGGSEAGGGVEERNDGVLR